ncbi:MAG: biopolymer transporter ExbD [Cellvibrionaceae bacterium]
MHFRRQKIGEEGVNLTPLIDVVFLLLIFFMVSTTFTKESHLKLDLPEASGEKVEAQKQELEILIQKDGSYAVNGKVLVNSKRETLSAAIEKESAGNTKIPVILTADANAAHQSVVTAMDVAGKLGLTHLRITTRQPKAKP